MSLMPGHSETTSKPALHFFPCDEPIPKTLNPKAFAELGVLDHERAEPQALM
jgi:hypothetical protein